MDVKVKVNMSNFYDAIGDIPKVVEKEANQIVGEFCEDVVRNAKLRVPVDTGRLKWSIRHMLGKRSTHTIEAGADHASYVEYGTSKMKAQPYLRPAINVYLPKVRSKLANILNGKKF